MLAGPIQLGGKRPLIWQTGESYAETDQEIIILDRVVFHVPGLGCRIFLVHE